MNFIRFHLNKNDMMLRYSVKEKFYSARKIGNI